MPARMPVPGHRPVHDRPLHPGRTRSSSPATRTSRNGQQPPSRPDPPSRIVWTFGRSLARETAEIEAGTADWTDDTLPGVAGLAARGSPGRCTSARCPLIVYTAFNTRVAPFDDPGVRRAFSLAAEPPPLRRTRRRPGRGQPHLPDPAARHSGLPALLPVHRRRQRLRPLDRHRPGRRPQAGGRVRDHGACASPCWSDTQRAGRGRPAAFTVSVLRELGLPGQAAHRVAPGRRAARRNDSRRRIQATDGALAGRLPVGIGLLRRLLPLFRVPPRRPRRHAERRVLLRPGASTG